MTLVDILIAPNRGEPMTSVMRAEAVAGIGISGDRYANGTGTFSQRNPIVSGGRQLSLIDYSATGICSERLGRAFVAADFRRNLVIGDMAEASDLRDLIGKTIAIGDVQIQIVSSCPPCRYLARLVDADMMTGLKHIGGVRAKILESGMLVVGSDVTVKT